MSGSAQQQRDLSLLIVALLASESCSRFADEGHHAGLEVDSDPAQNGELLDSEFVRIEPGSYSMGYTESDLDNWPVIAGEFCGCPAREITITRPFMLQRHEVTRGQWLELMGTSPSMQVGCEDVRCPVDSVSWYNAVAFANARSEHDGFERCYDLSKCVGTPGSAEFRCSTDLAFSLDCLGFRLATNAEFEYAARAGTTTFWWCGDDYDTCGRALASNWRQDGKLPEAPWPTGSGRPNPWGLYDMTTNLQEWVWDLVPRDSALDPSGVDPTTPRAGNAYPQRALRGSAFSASAEGFSSITYWASAPNNAWSDVGFRLSRTLAE
jgi:formylglycine-generating enzyme required for sulfatase activity